MVLINNDRIKNIRTRLETRLESNCKLSIRLDSKFYYSHTPIKKYVVPYIRVWFARLMSNYSTVFALGTGSTPQRRDFVYDRNLVATEPHEQILARYRQNFDLAVSLQ